jgi:hypothetical protein
MKRILISLSSLLIVASPLSLISWTNSPGDPGEIKRERADQLMTLTYGSNWLETYAACRKTNRAQLIAMTATYQSAIGFHRAR